MTVNASTIQPSVKLFNPGEELKLYTSLKNPSWVLEGAKVGRLQPDADGATYTAPSGNHEAGKKSSDINSLVKTDIVTAFQLGQYYSSTMLTFMTPLPLGWKLEISSEGDEKKIVFSKLLKTREWEVVPLQDTSWYTLSGNGRIDNKTGSYFSSGDYPMQTCIMALDERRQYEWAFTAIIIETEQ